MLLELEGKVAVVTGSTAGIGKATAAALAREGAKVVVNGRSRENLDKTVAELKEFGHVTGVAADVATAEGTTMLVEAAEQVGPIEILINNAGMFEPMPFEQIPDEEWEAFFRANVLSGVRTSRLVLPKMRDRGWGRVIFVSSESAISIDPGMIHYSMTKTAQLSISRGLAKAYAGTGVNVNAVLPGPTWTEGVEEFVSKVAAADGKDPAELREGFVPAHRSSSLIGRFATVDEVANLIVFLCSERASAITGSAQRVEGGIVDTCF